MNDYGQHHSFTQTPSGLKAYSYFKKISGTEAISIPKHQQHLTIISQNM
jgi:hypothetical protein